MLLQSHSKTTMLASSDLEARDLVGYGPHPPHPNWPNKAAIAISFVLNYEEGGENTVLNQDAASEVFLNEVIH
jgi:allantoinase